MAYRISCGPPVNNEWKPIKHIESLLSDHKWIMINNIGTHIPDLNEIDVLLIGQRNIVCVELKKWQGSITTSTTGGWPVSETKKTYTNPLHQASNASIRLRNLIGDYFERKHLILSKNWVSYLVVLTGEQSRVLYHDERYDSQVFHIRDFMDGLGRHLKSHELRTESISHSQIFIGNILQSLTIDKAEIKKAIEYCFGITKSENTVSIDIKAPPGTIAGTSQYSPESGLNTGARPEQPVQHRISPGQKTTSQTDEIKPKPFKVELPNLQQRALSTPAPPVAPAKPLMLPAVIKTFRNPVSITILFGVLAIISWFALPKIPSTPDKAIVTIPSSHIEIRAEPPKYQPEKPHVTLPPSVAKDFAVRSSGPLDAPKPTFFPGIVLPPDPLPIPEPEFAVRRGQGDSAPRSRFFTE